MPSGSSWSRAPFGSGLSASAASGSGEGSFRTEPEAILPGCWKRPHMTSSGYDCVMGGSAYESAAGARDHALRGSLLLGNPAHMVSKPVSGYGSVCSASQAGALWSSLHRNWSKVFLLACSFATPKEEHASLLSSVPSGRSLPCGRSPPGTLDSGRPKPAGLFSIGLYDDITNTWIPLE